MRAERAGVEILLAQIVTFYNDPLSCLPAVDVVSPHAKA